MEPVQPETVPQPPDDESDLDEESTALEYARLQSIALDHLNPELPLSDLRLAQQNHESINSNQDVAILEDHALASISTLIPDGFTDPRESLTVSKESLTLLGSVTGKLGAKDETYEMEKTLHGLLNVRSKGTAREKLELPVLRSDHELDVANWRGREEPVVEDLNVPREPVDEGRGEGLAWGTEMKVKLEKIGETIAGEKLTLGAEGAVFLVNSIRDGWCEDDDREVWEREACYKRNTAREPLTPPLQPLSPPASLFIPSSPTMELPLLSDPSSLISADLQAAEAEIFKDDQILPLKPVSNNAGNDSSDTIIGDADVNQNKPYSPLAFLEETQISPVPQRTRASDHKVEVPLTPPNPTMPKTVKFNHIVEEMLLDAYPDDGRTSTQPSQNGFEEEDQKFFLEALGPLADIVDRKVQQEQLKSADSLGRVAVPLMDFSLPPPPWAQLHLTKSAVQVLAFQKAFIHNVIEQHSVPPIWRGSKKIDKELRWVPFPSELGKVAINEQIDDDGGLAELLSLTSLKDVGDSSSLTWKPEGLRILKDDEDEEDEDLDLGYFSEKQPRDMTSLLQKRKLELMEERKNSNSRNSNLSLCSDSSEYWAVENMVQGKESRNKRRRPSPIERADSPYLPPACQALLTMPYKRPGNPVQTEKTKAEQNKRESDSATPNLLLGGIFSAGNALDNFMEIRGSKRQKLTDSSYFANISSKTAPIQKKPLQKLPPERTEGFRQPTHQTIPLPELELEPIPRNIIVSSSILKNRPLIRHLTDLVPNLTMIERDFSAHNTTIWQPNTVARSPITSPLNSEADLIISPTTSIIITSLQAIKQKPLPGSKARNKVLERILSVAPRYERVIVFVTGMDEFSVDLNEDDCLKLAEFIGFCSAPTARTQNSTSISNINPHNPDNDHNDTNPTFLVTYIPPSPIHLATHIASTLAKYGSPHSEPFLAEETVWELFLRRAGMNAFAAQSIIGALKEPEGVDLVGTGSASKKGLFGIRAFVEMGAEERSRRFGALIGREVVERVGEGIDGMWG